jgi:predicted enzyme related to lactoylglutathione lyase
MIDRDQGFFGWQVGSAFFSVLAHSGIEGNTNDPGRIMVNFETAQVKEEFERIKAIGAVVIREPYTIGEGWIATLADPDGNYFQLMTPMGS